MEFWNRYSSAITRLLITHIGMAVFGTVVLLMTNARGNTIMLVCGILSVLFFGAIVYTTAWEFGAKDKPAIDAGRLSPSAGRGFFISLCAEGVPLLLTVVMLVTSIFGTTYTVCGSICAVTYAILVLLNSCFTGIMLYFNPQNASFVICAIVYILGSLLISGFAAFGYSMGAKDKTLFPTKKGKQAE